MRNERNKLTKREEDILFFIYGYESDYGFVPSFSQIAESFGLSKARISLIVKSLINRGRLAKKDQHEYRGYTIAIDKVNTKE